MPLTDVAGRNAIRLDGEAAAFWKFAQRLRAAGCPVNTVGTDWLDPSRFDGLATPE